MLKLFILLLLTTLIYAKTPNIYSNLGDVIYENSDNIYKLKSLSKYQTYSKKINYYMQEVEKLKVEGFKIDNSKSSIAQIKYLEKLRELSKINDSFYKLIRENLKISIKEKDNNLFTQTINSGLINKKKFKNKILKYYFAHQKYLKKSILIKNYLEEDAKLSRQYDAKQKESREQKRAIDKKMQEMRKYSRVKNREINEILKKEVLKTTEN